MARLFQSLLVADATDSGGSPDMRVDGRVTPVNYDLVVPPGESWEIIRSQLAVAHNGTNNNRLFNLSAGNTGGGIAFQVILRNANGVEALLSEAVFLTDPDLHREFGDVAYWNIGGTPNPRAYLHRQNYAGKYGGAVVIAGRDVDSTVEVVWRWQVRCNAAVLDHLSFGVTGRIVAVGDLDLPPVLGARRIAAA